MCISRLVLFAIIVSSNYIASGSSVELQTTAAGVCSAGNGSQCPTWYVMQSKQPENSTCECTIAKTWLVECNQMELAANILEGVCSTYDETENIMMAGLCPFNHHKHTSKDYSTRLPCNVSELNSFMCDDMNRTGNMCAHCKPGLGPAVLSFPGKCLECLDSRYGWLVFLAVGLLPMTFLYVVVIVYRINASSAPMNAFIFVIQYITTYMYFHRYFIIIVKHHVPRLLVPFHLALDFYGFWNVEFFRHTLPKFCLSEKQSPLLAIALEYIVAIYPLVLLILISACIDWHDRGCKPIARVWALLDMYVLHIRRSWAIKGSVINAFVTVILLSYSKLLQISISLLTPAWHYKYDDGGNLTETVIVPYYDPSMQYFSSNHIPYFILGIVMLLTFNLAPTLFLLLHPITAFQRCLNHLPNRQKIFLNTFADAFQGCYKNGTGGTADRRYFAGLYLVFRVALYLPAIAQSFHYAGLLKAVLSVAIAALFFILKPYNTYFYSLFDGLLFIAIAAVSTYIWMVGFVFKGLSLIPIYIALCLPLIYIVLYFFLKILPQNVFFKALVRYVRSSPTRHRATQEETVESGGGSEEEELPHRLEHPSEYSPLLPQASNPLPQETREEATAAAAANTLQIPSNSYGAIMC